MIGLRKIYTSDKMSIYYIGTRKGGALGDTGAYPAGGCAMNPLRGAPSSRQQVYSLLKQSV